MDRRVLVGAGLLAAALIAAVVRSVSSDGVRAPISAPPTVVAPDPAPPPEPPRTRARVAAADTTTEDDAPTGDDGRRIRVSGLVVDDTGAKLPGAAVSAWRMLRGRRTDIVETTSDADGRFVLQQVAPGSLIDVRFVDSISEQERCGGADLEILLVAIRRRAIRGRFTQAQDATLPAAGVPIRSPRGVVVCSDDDGRWSLDVYGSDLAECVIAPPGVSGSESWATMSMSLDASVTEVEVEVVPAGTLRGRVVDADGNGVEAKLEWSEAATGQDARGAIVRSPAPGVVLRMPLLRLTSASSAHSGEFEIPGVRSGHGGLAVSASDRGAGLLSRSLPLRVWRDSSPGGADDRVVRVAVGTRVGRLISYRERSAQERLEVRLARASRITGRVTGPHEGVVGARVSAHGEGVDGIAVWALVREGGTFELTGVPHGERVTLSVSLEPGWRAESPAYATGGDSDLEIRVVSRGETIRGTLLDARGGPAVGKLISARRARHLLAEPSPPVVVDTDGRFELPCSPGVASELVVDGLVLGVASAGDDVVVRFPECHLLRGKVHTATGLPIVGTAWIESTDPAWPFSAQVIDGAFEVPAVPAGERSIMLIVYAPPSSEIVDALRKDGREDAIARWRGGASTHLEARTLTIPCGDIEFVITEKKKR